MRAIILPYWLMILQQNSWEFLTILCNTFWLWMLWIQGRKF